MKLPPARITIPAIDIPEIEADFREVLRSGVLTLGPFTEEFEAAFASSLGIEHAIAVNSGTSALEIILRCLDVSGKNVIIPTNTFFATPAAALHAGARVKLVDIESHMMIDPDAVERSIDSATAAVIVVHIGGYIHPAIHQIRDTCADHKIPLVEDAAHAHGSRLANQVAGTFGAAAGFSFYPTKVITSAEGGILTTNDQTIAKRARIFRDQGKAGFGTNYHVELGYNWRMSELHAVLGLHQLRRLRQFVARRTAVAEKYSEGLRGSADLTPMAYPKQGGPNFYKYVVFLKTKALRKVIKERLETQYGMSLSGEVYETPCHMQPVFRSSSAVESKGTLSIAEDLCTRHVCLPIYSDMSDSELE